MTGAAGPPGVPDDGMVHDLMEIPETIESDGGWTVRGAGPGLLAVLLRQYTKLLRDLGFPMQTVAAGTDAVSVREVMTNLGVGAPEELIEWFGWQNGLVRNSGGHIASTLPIGFVPASLEFSAATYEIQLRDWIPEGLWAKGWISLESKQGLSLYCDGDPHAPCLVRQRFIDEYDFVTEYQPYQVLSLCTVVSWWLEALATHAAWRDSTLSGWDFDAARCAEIDHGTLVLS